MRGYGSVHPVIGELRVGFLPVSYKNPGSGLVECIGEIQVTEAEVISRIAGAEGPALFSLGYGLCFGHNETKAIAMAVLDRAMACEEPAAPSEDQEFVLTHVDGIESMGFCNHYKLPHYVTFQSELDRLRNIQAGQRRNQGYPFMKPSIPSKAAPSPADWRDSGPSASGRYSYAFLDEGAKREIRRKMSRLWPSPAARSPSARARCRSPGVGAPAGCRLTLALIGPDDVLKVIDQGSDDSVNAVNIKKFVRRVTGVAVTTDTRAASLIQTRHRVPEEPLPPHQLLIFQVPIRSRCAWWSPRSARPGVCTPRRTTAGCGSISMRISSNSTRSR